MAKVGIELRIDVSKIDKARLFKGAKGTYLTMTTFVDLNEKDQWENNGFIAEKVTKEEQQQGVKGNILGNAKVFWSDGQQQTQQAQQAPQQRQQAQHVPPAYQAPQQNLQQAVQQSMAQQPQMYQHTAGGEEWEDEIPFAPIGLQYGRSLIHAM